MKQVTSELAAHLAQETTTLTRLLKITRTDGTVLRFTDFDRDFFFRDDGPSKWLPRHIPASPWWSLRNDVFTHNVFAGPGVASFIGFTPASGDWGPSQTFSGSGSNGDADFLGNPAFVTDYTFETAVSVHAESLLSVGGIRTGVGTGNVWATTDKYIGFSVSKVSGSGWTNWMLRMNDGTTVTTVDSGVPLADVIGAGAAGGTRTKLKVIVNADGSQVAWYINDRLVGLETANIPTAPLALSNHFDSQGFSGNVFYRTEQLSVTARVEQGGGTYKSQDGMDFTAIEHKADGSVNNLQATGFLTADGLAEADVRARLYDGAQFQMRTVNWADLTQKDLKILSGYLGDITMENGKFTMDLRGLTQKLTTQIGSKYGLSCRAELFGGGAEGIDPANHWKCRLNRADWVQDGTVLEAADTITLIPSPSSALLMVGSSTPTDPAPAGWFDDGVILFTSGALSGMTFEIQSWDGATLFIFGGAPMPFLPAPGDTFEIEPGCSKTITTCSSKFNNVVNFAGEPMIPGLNVLSVVGRPQVQTK